MNVIFISHSIFQKKGGKNETFTWNMHIHANDFRAAFHHRDYSKVEFLCRATIYLIIGFASLVISLYLAGKKFLLGISFIAFIFSLLIICFTIFIYFLPEAGMPPEIPLFE
ncbi:hypothetical protein [Peribacillus frigoritolerans]|uniref:hypothetical protein n=1 Tax=Peribacillus frigoritolerans TaxID=450367 RepID=UPI00203FFA90|nr:hypothetical protein [Peribacillus frigoritolerans]MCM3169295.1 hypothetical protein [Peribacillus frigoritolerans]